MQFIMEIPTPPSLIILVLTPPPPSPNPYPPQSHPVPHRSHSNSNSSSYRPKPNSKRIRPCLLCVYKNFNASPFTLSEECGVRKLSSVDIIKIIDITRTCPSCGNGHPINYQCRPTFNDGQSRFCAKGCKHNGYPLHFAACKHKDESPLG